MAALYLLHHLVEGFAGGDPRVTEVLQTRTFYVVPPREPRRCGGGPRRHPSYHRSSVRPWPWQGHRWPGIQMGDVDGDGRVLTMRVPDPNGAWVEHPEDARVMVPVAVDGDTAGRTRYRLFNEGDIADFDGFTVPTPRDPKGLDLNRNFPAGWGTGVTGSATTRSASPRSTRSCVPSWPARTCAGTTRFHTYGGVLLRPSSTQADATLPPLDLWAWEEFGRRGTTTSPATRSTRCSRTSPGTSPTR